MHTKKGGDNIPPFARTGRPKSDKSKNVQIAVRFTDSEFAKLDKFATQKKLSKSEVVRKSVDKYIDDDQKNKK